MQRPPWAACEYCHGSEGRIDSPDVPAIAGQSAAYIAKQLADFRSGRRLSPQAQMRSAMMLLDPDDEAEVARHFASQSALSVSPPATVPADPGSRLYWSGSASVMACVTCHAASSDTLTDGRPFLFGLDRDYLVRQLRAFRDESRANDLGGEMRAQAAALSDLQILALATYLASADSR